MHTRSPRSLPPVRRLGAQTQRWLLARPGTICGVSVENSFPKTNVQCVFHPLVLVLVLLLMLADQHFYQDVFRYSPEKVITHALAPNTSR
jgi:hypothetical protein